jgi:hypothetical protein
MTVGNLRGRVGQEREVVMVGLRYLTDVSLQRCKILLGAVEESIFQMDGSMPRKPRPGP